jgi:fructose-bisphosphate aldolase class I
MDGNHSAEDCFNKTSEVINNCFEQLLIHNIDLTGIILKPNMILPGNKSDNKISSEDVAKLTLKCLKENVPTDVPGIAFLSGGQSEQQATNNLDAINKINDTNFLITYSYGRALQQSALKTWSKEMSNIKAIHDVFNHRARMNGLASKGEWSQALEI